MAASSPKVSFLLNGSTGPGNYGKFFVHGASSSMCFLWEASENDMFYNINVDEKHSKIKLYMMSVSVPE
jgi:hypothetical protein